MKKQALSLSIKTKKDTQIFTVKWKEATGEERQCKSMDFPRPELLDTLTAFLPLLPNYTGIPADNIKWAEIAGGNFEYTKGGAVTLSLGVAVVIKGVGGYTFKSPELTVDLEHADINTAEDWRDKYSALAKFLHDEIIMYAEGKRAQGNLFVEEGETDAGMDTYGAGA